MTDVGFFVEVAFHEEVVLAGGRIDLRHLIDAASIVGHVIGLAELAFHHDEDGLHDPLLFQGTTLARRAGEESRHVIAETHGCGLVTPVVPTLAPLRTMIRLALALRPVLLGAVLARPMLARPLFTRPLLTRRRLARLLLLGTGFGVGLGRRPRLALVMLARLLGLAARAARLVARATAATTTSAATTVGGFEVGDVEARHLDAGNGGADQLLDRLD